MKIVRKIFLYLLFLFAILLIIAFAYYCSVTYNVKLNPEKLLFNEKCIIVYDSDGKEVQNTTSSLLKENISIKDLPQNLKDAFISTEDKRFYKHNGADFRRILRAFVNNFKARALKEGASTISQQLIKNTHLTQEKTLKRKLKEWKLTRELEHTYTKDEILERYLNTIYFGHNCFGVSSAAKFYFAKSPTELTLDECAILAGLVRSPNNYSPFKNPESCQRRKCIVLNLMSKMGAITQKEKNEAASTPLPSPKPQQDNGYLHFVFDELSSLSEKNNFSIGGKIEIFTFLDQTLQTTTENIANGYSGSDKAFFVLDKDSHGFKACVSTVGNIPRLPGSIIKPLLVYAPAIEENLVSPATPILDAKINYNGYSPENHGGTYQGYVSVRECLEKSLNIPAVKILDSLTIDKGCSYLNALNLSVCKEDKSLALALGGMKEGYCLKDILSAYQALQNNGIFTPCTFISSIKINGQTIYKAAKTSRRVFSPETASLMTNMLKTTAQNGTAKKLRSLPFEIAAKTGTVGTNKGNTDAYAISYTSRDCAAVWLGNADNTKINHTGGGMPCQLLHELNEKIYTIYQTRNLPIKGFTLDKNVKNIELDKQAYYDTHTLMLADKNSPPNYRISELFKTSAIPLNRSDSFTCPTIIPPSISLSNNLVTITFGDHFPRYYTYKIVRYDYASHTTLYEGAYIHEFIDNTLSENKNYVYTITPIYNGKKGSSVSLPSVSTRKNEEAEIDDEILSKEWWKY